MVEEISAQISAERYTGEDEPFIPTGIVVPFKLVPKVEPEPAVIFSSFMPVTRPPIKAPETTPLEVPMIVDIETTGISPLDSRIVAIGIKNPALPFDQPEVILAREPEDEETALKTFIAKWEAGGYKKFVGYNADFDYRFLIVTAMKYLVKSPAFFEADIIDVMDFLKKGRYGFVPTFNKVNKMREWTEYFFGLGKTLTYPELLEAIAAKDWDKVEAYSKNDAELTYQLWNLINYSSTT